MRHRIPLALLVGLASCSDLAPEQQAAIRQVLTVACNVDGMVVPVAQPVVATLGPVGTKAAHADLLVHPADYYVGLAGNDGLQGVTGIGGAQSHGSTQEKDLAVPSRHATRP